MRNTSSGLRVPADSIHPDPRIFRPAKPISAEKTASVFAGFSLYARRVRCDPATNIIWALFTTSEWLKEHAWKLL
jgi:hypothetical protein